MQTVLDPKKFIVPTQGAVLCVPGAYGTARRVWMTQGAMQKSQHPQPGIFSLYSPDFFLEQLNPWYLPKDIADPGWVREFSPRELFSQIAHCADISPQLPTFDWTPPSRAFFEECFQDLQASFRSGQLTKAVPVLFENAASPSTPTQIAQRLCALLQAPETLIPYGLWSEQGGMLGGSPELLFEIRNGILKTVALAGTLAIPDEPGWNSQEDTEQAFLADSKERREHNLVIEGIAESLAPFGTVEISETEILKLPTLWHLRTPIEVTLQETPDFETVVRRLHPTPALGGSPRDASLNWLRQQDDQQGAAQGRGSFGAPFGAQFPDGSAFCLVAVRSMMWNADTVRIGAGCGVIRESRMEREWEELAQKRKSVKRLFGL